MIRINTHDGTPIYIQIVRQFKYLIATGSLKADDELPPVRILAQQLLINPNTVAKAYRELENQGLIYTRQGAGTYVAPLRVLFSEEERCRILYEHIDSLLVSAKHLNFSLPQLIELIQKRSEKIKLNIDKEKDND
ncbi:MAG TPA: GntR family transcriptional regulator [Candidatus Hydrogenedens sp.]|nr:GntR family transcriptional regulator [Candidatus Hydrogenedens sp.]HOL19601.1 GntR family transcriptional regulator [Candidatus Hydrogenedens sp.]HPP58883.1 GntR family transcriptional regulator [Candidatus Hydrogenedens sp.]